MSSHINALGELGRIRGIDRGANRIYIEVRSGQTLALTIVPAPDWQKGNVLFITEINGTAHAEKVSVEIWPDDEWVGIVRLRLKDETVVDTSGRLRLVPTSAVQYGVGNTVVGRDVVGVQRVLSDEPVRLLDLPDVDESVAATFIQQQSGLSFDDFAGYPDVIRRAKGLVERPLEHHEALLAMKTRLIKGVLFFGLPGTGKTLLARIIASRTEATFYQISGPEILSKWYGESEKVLRAIFSHAAKQNRSIIFFDEIDSLASHRSAEAHEVSRRVVAQLLTLMDGFDASQNTVVIAATNRPQDVDVALMRPGRFDWKIEFGLPTLEDRLAILKLNAKRSPTYGWLPHDVVAANTMGWNGADLAAVWSEAALLAVDDQREVIMAEDYLGGYGRVGRQRVRVATATNSSRP